MNIKDFRIVFILKIYFQEANNYVEDLIRPGLDCKKETNKILYDDFLSSDL